MCGYAQSCAFISVIELPRIPAYYPKTTTKKITGIKSAIKLKKGKTYKLKPKKVPANSDYKISYNSSNKKVATVSSKGVITARKKGSTTITIKSGKISVKCKVTVK